MQLAALDAALVIEDKRVATIGIAKTRLPLISMLMLGALAGAFIGLGALYFVLIKSDGIRRFSVPGNITTGVIK
jgi:formate/nitrite transporter FocA (FNT family)